MRLYSKTVKNFYRVLVNTVVANVATSYLWFALTFWIYLETRSVLATGIIGGIYMLMVAVFSIVFGTVVDAHKKKQVMVFSSTFTLISFVVAGLIYYFASQQSVLINVANPMLWLFSLIILAGCIIENMRNIVLSTVVTLMVEKDKRGNANGLVGTVQGIGFMLTSVFSGLSIGLLGMGWTLVIAIVFMALALLDICFVKIPEDHIAHDPELDSKKVDVKGSILTIMAVPGLLGLIIFSTFNNLIGGVYMTLMDPYGLTIFSVEMWGIIFGLAGTGFIVGGILVAKFGLGKNPLKTLLLVVVLMGLLGSLFTIREWWWLYVLGIWLYMLLIPAAEATEQTIIQRVVPFKRQGRVFGFAQAFESAAAPITAFLIAPIAEFIIIPYVSSESGKQTLSWLLGNGEARGIALVFLVSGLIMGIAALLAFKTKSYQNLSRFYAKS